MQNNITHAGGCQQTQSQQVQTNEPNTDYTTVCGSISDIESQRTLLLEAINNHASYTDLEGKTGSNPQWFLFQIKKKITEAIGKEFYRMPYKEVQLIGDLYDMLHLIILEGEESSLTRREIKDCVYSQILAYSDTFIGGSE